MQHRTMIERQTPNAAWRKDGLRKKRRVLIVSTRESATGKVRESQPFPNVTVARDCERDAWSVGPERRVRHDVGVEYRDEGYPRVLTTVAADTRAKLVRRLGFEGVPNAFVRGFVRGAAHFDECDAGDVAVRNDAWIQEQPAIARARRAGIQNAGDLARVAVRLQRHSKAR